MKKKPKEIKGLSDLIPDPENANSGTPRGSGMVEYSLRNYGAGRSILADSRGIVRAGNKTLEKAAELGLEIEVVHTRGDKLVVVVRDDLDETNEEMGRALALADNRTSELGLDWNLDILGQFKQETPSILESLWMPEELERLFDGTITPDFQPVGEDEQGRLDQKKPIRCPKCGHEFIPK